MIMMLVALGVAAFTTVALYFVLSTDEPAEGDPLINVSVELLALLNTSVSIVERGYAEAGDLRKCPTDAHFQLGRQLRVP